MRSFSVLIATTFEVPLLLVPLAGSSLGSMKLVGWIVRPLAVTVISPAQ